MVPYVCASPLFDDISLCLHTNIEAMGVTDGWGHWAHLGDSQVLPLLNRTGLLNSDTLPYFLSPDKRLFEEFLCSLSKRYQSRKHFFQELFQKVPTNSSLPQACELRSQKRRHSWVLQGHWQASCPEFMHGLQAEERTTFLPTGFTVACPPISTSLKNQKQKTRQKICYSQSRPGTLETWAYSGKQPDG